MSLNNLNAAEFQFAIERIEGVTFTAQRVTLPGLSGGIVKVPSPFNETNRSYDKIEYSPLSLSFLINEDLSNYLEIINWMLGIGAPENHNQYAVINNSVEGIESDITVTIYNNQKNPVKKITYFNCMPIDISEIELSLSETESTVAQATVSFAFDKFSISNP